MSKEMIDIIVISCIAIFALLGLIGGLSESDDIQEGDPYP